MTMIIMIDDNRAEGREERAGGGRSAGGQVEIISANNNLLKALLLHGQRLSRREPQLCYLNPENRHQEASVDTASLNLAEAVWVSDVVAR